MAGGQEQQYVQQLGVSPARQGEYAYAQAAEPLYAPLAAVAAAPQPQAVPAPAATQHQRMMAFRVPDGVQAGALIRVTSPANTAVDVSSNHRCCDCFLLF